MKNTLIALAIAITSFAAQANPTMLKDGVMTGADGRALYTFDKDAPGKSNCSGNCLVNWPAFIASDASKADADFSIITRDDGAKQWAYKGMPVYYYIGDTKAGEVTGDGKGGGTWHVLRGAK